MITLINDDILKVDFSAISPVQLIITSPPYNCGIDYDKHQDIMTYPDYLQWCHKWLKLMYDHMADDGRICINLPFTINPTHSNKKRVGSSDNHIHYPVVADYTHICQSIGFTYWRTVIWDKPISMKTCWGSFRSASAPFMRDPCEAILVLYKNQWKRLTVGVSTITGPEFMSWTKSSWTFPPETKSFHPAAFPTELPNRCIKLFSYKEDLICDPFMGSGSTGAVAALLNRNFLGVELSTDYFSKAKEEIDRVSTQMSIIQRVMPTLLTNNPEEMW